MDTQLPQLHNEKVKLIFGAVLIGGLLYIAGQYVGSLPERMRQEVESGREITVNGVGEVEIKPDVAMLTLSVQTETVPSTEAANAALEERFNAVLAAVREFDIEEEDIKTTNLSVNPVYNFSDGDRRIQGYEASQSVELKIRDTDTVGEILSAATVEGVTQAGGIRFDVDDSDAAELEAQEEAIEDAREKAEELARVLGVRLGDVKTFSTSLNNGGIPIPYATARAELSADGLGGGVETPTGVNTIQANVTVTYTLR